MPIGARADGAEAIRALYELGIQEVTSPEFEAGIEMTREALTYFNVPAHEILHVASAIRRERYGLPGNDAQSTSPVGEVLRQLDFTWFRLSPDSAFNGRTIGALRIRATIGVSVAGLIHDGVLHANPDSETRFSAGDLVGVLGTRDQIARFEEAVRVAETRAPAP
jgi:CPA2 family monovalent cation:H+ antiporter-2